MSVRTTCPYCGVGCGIVATPDGRGGAGIAGDPEHPANRGRLCSKGAALGETLSLEDRLLHPEIDGQRVSWETALDTVADGFREIIGKHGPDAVAFYVSGQLLTEDYYAANKLIKGFLGTANIDTNSRLCMASSVAGHKRAFGSDTVPGPLRGFRAGRSRRPGRQQPRLVPSRAVPAARSGQARAAGDEDRGDRSAPHRDLRHRRSPSRAEAGQRRGAVQRACWRRCSGAAWSRATSSNGTRPAWRPRWPPRRRATSRDCDLPAADVATFFDWFARTEKTVTLYSQGVNQSSAGVDKVNALINCHLLTGRIGRPGMGPFSITGQPNAMGGREVGALSNTLAAHMDFAPADVDRVGRFWRAPRMATKPGLKAVDLFEAVGRGEIKAVWIMATNPVASLPNADAVRDALANCEYSIVSEAIRATDTVDACRIRLPALAWAEKDGTVTNSERGISRQRPFLPAPGEARQDWWILSQVARRLGFGEAFAWTGVGRHLPRARGAVGLREQRHARFRHRRLRQRSTTRRYRAARAVRLGRSARFFADGGFFHADRRARFIATVPRPPAHAPDIERPLRLNTGRVRDQWHTMTRTGKSVRLAGHRPEPTVELHPRDAAARGIADGAVVRIESRWGRARAACASDR